MKIIVIDDDREIYTRLDNIFKENGIKDTLIYSDTVGRENISKDDVLVINNSMMKDNLEFLEARYRRIIVLNDQLMHGHTDLLSIKNIAIHYKQSPISALIYKIYGQFVIKSNNKIKPIEPDGTKVVALMSAAGGTGKTTLAINLGIHYSKANKKVLLIDFSSYSSMGISLHINKHSDQLGKLIDYMKEDREDSSTSIKDVIKGNILRYKYKQIEMDLMCSQSPLKMEKLTSDDIEVIMTQLRHLQYDVILVDTGSQLSEVNLAIAELADEIVFVSSADISSGWKLLQKKEILGHLQLLDRCKLVINKHTRKSGFHVKELENELQYELLGTIPFDHTFTYNNNHRLPIACYHHKLNRSIRAIASKIMPYIEIKGECVNECRNIYSR